MTLITENLIGIIVPEDSKHHVVTITDKFYYLQGYKKTMIQLDSNPRKQLILGTVTKEGQIDFDCERFVEKYENGDYPAYDYIAEQGNNYLGDDWGLETKEQSFLSLLKSKGIEIAENEKLVIIEKV